MAGDAPASEAPAASEAVATEATPTEATDQASESLESAPEAPISSATDNLVPGYFIDNTKPENERVVETMISLDQSYKIIHKVTDAATATEETPEAAPTETSEPAEAPDTTDDIAPEETPADPEPQAEVYEEPLVPTEEQVAVSTTPVAPPLRLFTKKVFVNKEAVHTCVAEVFNVDMSDRTAAENTLILTKEADIAYELEVGGLPTGIDVRFSENNEYHKQIGSTEETIDFSITKKDDAAKGSFTIPIIYTQKGVFDSSVVCQINVINK